MKQLLLVLFISVFLINSCGQKDSGKSLIIASNHPVAEILKEIAGDDSEIYCPLPTGATPHTYSPKPSEMKKIESAEVFFYVSENLDSWAGKIQCKHKIRLMDFLPEDMVLKFEHHHSHKGHEHHHGHHDGHNNNDPHFWTDPLAVKAIINSIADTLGAINNNKAGIYRANAANFADKLNSLDSELSQILSGVKGEAVFLFHPSFRYMLKRYGLVYGGAIEESPGKEPTPKYIARMLEMVDAANAKAIFTEPQLPPAPAKAIAEAGNLKLAELDPVGGVEGRMTYFEILLYNANTLAEALK